MTIGMPLPAQGAAVAEKVRNTRYIMNTRVLSNVR